MICKMTPERMISGVIMQVMLVSQRWSTGPACACDAGPTGH